MDIKYKECYVAYLDILGFKKIVANNDSTYVYNILNNIINPFDNNNSKINFSDVKLYIMSDSVVFYIETEKRGSLIKLISCCAKLIERFSFHNEPIFFRGAITKGNLYVSNRVIFGDALIESYLLENSSAIYPRIIMAKSLLEEGKKKDLLYNNKEFRELYELPIVYYDHDGWMCIENWFLAVNKLYIHEIIKNESFFNLYNYVENIVFSSSENKIKEKYIYLKDHFDNITS